MQKLLTNKLFYGKYAYKVNLYMRGSNYIGLYGLHRLMDAISKRQIPFQANIDNVSLTSIGHFLLGLEGSYRTRIEHNELNVYFDNKNDYTKFVEKFKVLANAVYEPQNDNVESFLKGNNKKVIRNNLPSNIYRYKVHFKIMSVNDGENIVKWAENNTKVRLNNGPKKSLLKTVYPNAYLYVEDQPTLTLCRLIGGQNISRIEEYVLTSEV